MCIGYLIVATDSLVEISGVAQRSLWTLTAGTLPALDPNTPGIPPSRSPDLPIPWISRRHRPSKSPVDPMDLPSGSPVDPVGLPCLLGCLTQRSRDRDPPPQPPSSRRSHCSDRSTRCASPRRSRSSPLASSPSPSSPTAWGRACIHALATSPPPSHATPMIRLPIRGQGPGGRGQGWSAPARSSSLLSR